MARAYKCDICGRIFEGVTDMQLTLSQGLERALRFVLGIKFSPENEQASIYIKDCCIDCAKSFTDWYKMARIRAGIQ